MIRREPYEFSKKKYDLIIIGGGIYGAMLSFEASRAGLRSLLIERNDFGQHTSFNCLRIIHGGLRYLQDFDLHRFRESVGERRWFLLNFPNHVWPLSFMMPLYGKGLKRTSIFRMALKINHLLSFNKNRGLDESHRIFPGKILNIDQTIENFSMVQQSGLQGSAVWYDAIMPDSQLLLIDILHHACERGARALNYCEAKILLKSGGNANGVLAIDMENQKSYEYRADSIINAAGPWCREIATAFHKDESFLFNHSLAFNLLLNKKNISKHALAVSPNIPDAQIFFLIPWKNKIFVGTGHYPWRKEISDQPMPTKDQIDEFIVNLNLAVPGLDIKKADILRIFSGFLPATEVGGKTLSTREIIFDHSTNGGPRNLYSISGVKYTTSRLVAEKTIRALFPKQAAEKNNILKNRLNIYLKHEENQTDHHQTGFSALTSANWEKTLERLIQEESIVHLDDLIFRRTALWEKPERVKKMASNICNIFNWDEQRCSEEMARLKEAFDLYQYSYGMQNGDGYD